MADWKLYSSSGIERCTVKELEYHDIWMGEEYVIVTILSPTPISLQVGDYLTYRGLTYSIYSLPTALKQARKNSYGHAFKYENVKLSSRGAELADIRFHDIVLSDNEITYTSLPTFDIYCVSVDDLVDRLLANTDKSGETPWLFITPNYSRTVERYSHDADRQAEAIALWEATFGSTHVSEVDEKNVVINVNDISVRDALAFIKNYFGLNFIIRERNVIVGGEGIVAEQLFKYGKDNGLYEIEKSADSEQQIVTKLYAYGSNTNLPIRYYANINLVPFGNVTLNNDYIIATDVEWDETNLFGHTTSTGYHAVTIEHNGTTYTNIVVRETDTGFLCIDKNLSSKGYPSASVGDVIQFTGNVKKDTWPSDKRTGGNAIPDNMAVNVLMLPSFPTYALCDLCRCVTVDGNTQVQIRKTPASDYTVLMTLDGEHNLVFSDNKYRPYILSDKAETIGIKEGDINFTEEDDTNGLKAVYPSIEGMTVGDVEGTTSDERLDEVLSAEQITDNGVYADGEEVKNFTITLKDLGFDLNTAYANGGSAMVVAMKDGYCGGREFDVKGVKQNTDGTWTLNVERKLDDSLQLWFPYNGAQIQSADHFVLTGIELGDTNYVWAASVKALRKAITFLLNNDYTRYTYLPKVDEIKMYRQHRESEQRGLTSMYLTLKAGYLMLFEDSDLDVDGSVFIDSLTIKENGNKDIPTYDIVLRNDKQVSSLQRVQNQISTLTSIVTSGGGGGGLSVAQIRSLIKSYGNGYFLSKLTDDTAAGIITFVQGLISNGPTVFSDILKSKDAINDFLNGTGIYMDAETGLIQTDALEVRGWMKIMELVINRLQLMDSDYSFTEGGTVEHIDVTEDGQRMIFTMHKQHDNDITPFYVGDILYAKINNLDEEGTYFTSWVRVESVDQEANTLTVVPYVGYDSNGPIVPASKNFTPQGTEITDDIIEPLLIDYANYPDGYDIQMNVTRHGNIADGIDPETGEYSESIHTSQIERQQAWVLSTSDKRLSFFWNVDAPIIKDENYALCLGILPDLANLPSTRNKRMPSLYVNTVFADHYDKANYPAKIVKEDRGSFSTTPTSEYTGAYDGSFTPDGTLVATDEELSEYADWISIINGYAGTYAVGDTISENYHYRTFTKNDWLTYRLDTAHYGSFSDKTLFLKMIKEWRESVDLEVSRVWRESKLWECMVDGTTEEPSLGCSDWRLVSGDTKWGIAFESSNGTSFYQGFVNTTVQSYLYWGQEDVTSDVPASSFVWTRSSESGKTDADRAWDAMASHQGVKSLTITDDDMPTAWSRSNKAIFTLTVTISDDIIVENNIIA